MDSGWNWRPSVGWLRWRSAHDLPVLGLGADLQAVGQALAAHGQRVVAHGLERALDALEEAPAVGRDRGGLAVHESPGRDHLGAEGQRDGLVPEADPQDRDAAGEAPDGGDGDARRPRAGRGPGR